MQHYTNQLPVILLLTVFTVMATVVALYFFLALKKTNYFLELEKKKIERGDFLRKRFFSNVSHEMKTPLNAIIGFSEQLLKINQATESKHFITNIKTSSEHIIHLVDNLLMFSFSDEEQIINDELPFSFSNIIDELKSIFAQKAREKGVGFIISINNKNNNDILLGDAKILKQILFNLYDNNIKFTLRGEIKSYFSFIEMEPGYINLEGRIIDTGIGISTKEINSIFSEFHQIDGSMTRKFGGVGLGLSICKRLIEKLKGGIKVKSNIGVGTVFEFSIPYKIPTPEQQKYLTEADKHIDLLNGMSFLVVDDDEYNRLLAKRRLEDWGAIVQLSKNGTEALINLSKNKYDLILLDIHMPDISGIEVSRILRGQEENINNKTLIIAVTATIKDLDNRNLFLEAGIDDCLSKPYKENELYDKIKFLIFKIKSDSLKNILPMHQNINRDYNLDDLKLITKGDNEFLVLMLNTFLNNNKENVEILEQSYKSGDFNTISEIAHKMLNSYRQLKVDGLLNELEELESLPEQEIVDKLSIHKHIEKINNHSKRIFVDIEKEIGNLA